MRSYDKIVEEGQYTIIYTGIKKYVLDCKYLSGDYLERRIKLMSMALPYLIYPLKYRFKSLSEIALNKKYTVFIDINGVVFKKKTSKLYPIVCEKIKQSYRDNQGNYIIYGSSDTPFKVPKYMILPNTNYISYIKKGMGSILFGVHATPVTRKRIKI